jgi:hypothetical protein
LQKKENNGTFLVNKLTIIDNSLWLLDSWKDFDQKRKANMLVLSQEINPSIEIKNFWT